ncbi:glucosaminidase domain-containing protein [Candidatus Methylocalor cossyra]|uniref:glucosaminidase domain-containing protein n=1 Tax=Candidatus Methylocalor cossyra TaxID=3108543 RepID=UPI0032B25111
MSSKTDFIASIANAARTVANESGLSYELMLAQAAQETGWGAKVLPGTNNIFNIKADSSWIGKRKRCFHVRAVVRLLHTSLPRPAHLKGRLADFLTHRRRGAGVLMETNLHS